jgi:hypothetical protein
MKQSEDMMKNVRERQDWQVGEESREHRVTAPLIRSQADPLATRRSDDIEINAPQSAGAQPDAFATRTGSEIPLPPPPPPFPKDPYATNKGDQAAKPAISKAADHRPRNQSQVPTRSLPSSKPAAGFEGSRKYEYLG